MAPVGNTKDLEVEKELGAWRETLGCVQWYRSLGIQNGTNNIDLDRSEGAAGDTYSAWGSESNPNGTRLPYRQHETRKLNEKAGMATRMRHECDAQMSATVAHTLPEEPRRERDSVNRRRLPSLVECTVL